MNFRKPSSFLSNLLSKPFLKWTLLPLLVGPIITQLLASSAQSQNVDMVIETPLRDNDRSHLTLEFSQVPLNQMLQNLQNQAMFDPVENGPHRLLVFIPRDLSDTDKTFFLNALRAQILGLEIDDPRALEESERLRLEIHAVELDVLQMKREALENFPPLQQLDALHHENTQEETKAESPFSDGSPGLTNQMIQEIKSEQKNFFNSLLTWAKEQKQLIKKLRHWKRWPIEQRHMFMGSWIGLGKTYLSVGWWMSSTGANVYGVAQSLMSVFLDFTFARWGHRIQAWKATHRIPELRDLRTLKPVNRVIQWYNDNNVIKDFVINNLIGITAGVYFRMLSWAGDTTGRVNPPWSTEYAEIVLGGMSIGGVMGSLGGQGVRTLRKKGHIPVGLEYALYQLFGLGMQIGGFLQGGGYDTAFWLFLKIEAGLKGTLFAVSRLLPNKTRRVLVFHEQIPKGQIRDLLYLQGLYDSYKVQDRSTQIMIKDRLEKGSSGNNNGGLCSRLFGIFRNY